MIRRGGASMLDGAEVRGECPPLPGFPGSLDCFFVLGMRCKYSAVAIQFLMYALRQGTLL